MIVQLLSVTEGRAREKISQEMRNPFSEWEKRLGKCETNIAYPNLMVPVTGRELAPAMEIYDPDPVAVAS
jgi:hypothetical protein